MTAFEFCGSAARCDNSEPHAPHKMEKYRGRSGWLDKFCVGQSGPGLKISVARRRRGTPGDAAIYCGVIEEYVPTPGMAPVAATWVLPKGEDLAAKILAAVSKENSFEVIVDGHPTIHRGWRPVFAVRAPYWGAGCEVNLLHHNQVEGRNVPLHVMVVAQLAKLGITPPSPARVTGRAGELVSAGYLFYYEGQWNVVAPYCFGLSCFTIPEAL